MDPFVGSVRDAEGRYIEVWIVDDFKIVLSIENKDVILYKDEAKELLELLKKAIVQLIDVEISKLKEEKQKINGELIEC